MPARPANPKTPEHPKTPDAEREAFVARRRVVGPVELQPFSLATLWLFEELKHPLNEGSEPLRDAGGEPIPLRDDAGNAVEKNGRAVYMSKPLSLRDTARAIYVCSNPEDALKALAGGAETFDAQAFAVAEGIHPKWLRAISEAIAQLYVEGLAALSGSGARPMAK